MGQPSCCPCVLDLGGLTTVNHSSALLCLHWERDMGTHPPPPALLAVVLLGGAPWAAPPGRGLKPTLPPCSFSWWHTVW